MRISILFTTVAALGLTAASGAAAAETSAPSRSVAEAAKRPKESGPKAKEAGQSAPSLDAIMGVFDKIFPPQPEPDPVRLALARTSTQAMWPDGAYAQMMSNFMGDLFDRFMQMKESDLAPLGTKKNGGASASAADRSIHDKAVAKDPNFDQRMAGIRDVLNDEIGKISATIDPRMREGLARAMAHRFDARQLTDINAFFATPSGRALAAQYMQLWVDPDTLRSMMGALPELVKLMPEISQKLKAVNDKFPKPKGSTSSGKPAKS